MGKSIQEEIQQRNWHNDQQVAVINILYTYHWVKGRISEALAPYKITMQQYNVLRILNGVFPGSHSRGEIARRMVRRAPDLTRMLDPRQPALVLGQLAVEQLLREAP